MQEQIGNVTKRKTLKSNNKEMLCIKNTETEMKNTLDGHIGILKQQRKQ